MVNEGEQEDSSLIGGKYKLVKKLGGGSFGEIFIGMNTQCGQTVAIKVEELNAKHPQLLYESRVYHAIGSGTGIAKVEYFGTESTFNAMVMQLLGPSLEDLFCFCSRNFTMKTVLMLVDQMITRLEFLHSKCFIHRDVKPDNFVMGSGSTADQVFLIDFGLSKKYYDSHTKVHISYYEKKTLTGTARYASINAHQGIEQSRRDDMEALGYVIMYFIRGKLPWQGFKAENAIQKYEAITEKKISMPVQMLCKGYPAEFTMYLNYCRGLAFAEEPDYNYMQQLFRSLFRTLTYNFDYIYDWTIMKLKVLQKQTKPNVPETVEKQHCEPAKNKVEDDFEMTMLKN